MDAGREQGPPPNSWLPERPAGPPISSAASKPPRAPGETGRTRIALGHGLLRVGFFIQRAATLLTVLCAVAVMVVLISALFGDSDFPAVFGGSGDRVGAGTYAWQGAVLIVALLLGGRVVLAGAFAWLGWHVLPQHHRDFLVELDDQAMRFSR